MSESLDVFVTRVTAETTWIFFSLSGLNGKTGVGEASAYKFTDELLAALPSAMQACNHCEFGLRAKLASVRTSIPGVMGRAISSALEQAWLDLRGKNYNQPIYDLLGGCFRKRIPTYANINRGTTSRTPSEFALRAQAALDAGYKAIKLAPFDGITPALPSSSDQDAFAESQRSALFQQGFARVAAVSKQLDGNAELNVDCHSRLRMSEVNDTIDRLAELDVQWFEEPVAETADALDQIATFRHYANSRGMVLAGAEKASGLADIVNFINAGSYDVLMPDIILAGGISEVLHMGHLASVKNSELSLHNPCGPVMDVMSAQVAAALPSFHSLERQFDESPLYDEIVEREHRHVNGEYILSDAPGAGCTLVCSHSAVEQVASYEIDI